MFDTRGACSLQPRTNIKEEAVRVRPTLTLDTLSGSLESLLTKSFLKFAIKQTEPFKTKSVILAFFFTRLLDETCL